MNDNKNITTGFLNRHGGKILGGAALGVSGYNAYKNAMQDKGISQNAGNIASNSVATVRNASNLDTTNNKLNAVDNRSIENLSNINKNADDIASNTGNIASNTGNIASNAGNIASNTGSVQGLAGVVNQNVGDIASNTGNIASNAGNIASNTGNIASNAGNIASNTGNIASNAGNIASNTGDISQVMAKANDPVGTALDQAKVFADNTLQNAGEEAQKIGSIVSGEAKAMTDGLKSAYANAAENVGPVWDKFTNWAGNLIPDPNANGDHLLRGALGLGEATNLSNKLDKLVEEAAYHLNAK